MAADPVTRQWWTLTDPCQEPFDTREEGAWWASMEEVVHNPLRNRADRHFEGQRSNPYYAADAQPKSEMLRSARNDGSGGEHDGIALDQPPITCAWTVPRGRKATKL